MTDQTTISSPIPNDIDKIASDLVRMDFSKADEPDYAFYLAIAEALNAERERCGWQPMETAPTDGTKFDVWMHPHGYRTCEVYWSDIQDGWCTEGDYGPEEPSPLTILPYPTHWMPLPRSPEASA